MNDLVKGAGGCFVAGTLIATPSGHVPIEQLIIGDKVIAFNHKGELVTETIELLHKHIDENVYKYDFWNELSVTATPNHWVLTQFNTFAEIDTLTEQDGIIDGNGHIRPLIKKVYVGVQDVYNLTISNTHTYIANNIRVHNTGSGEGRLSETVRGAKGGKGGGGGTRVPVEQPDSLRSIQYANVLDLVSEGEIYGLVDGTKSIYLDDTPLQNEDGSYNFNGVTIEQRVGTQAQAHISGFAGAEAEVPVGIEVQQSVSVTRTITNANATHVRVTLSTPVLSSQNMSNGDINGTDVEIAIDVQTDGGGFVTQKIRRIYSTDIFAISDISRNTQDSAEFNIKVNWYPSPNDKLGMIITAPNPTCNVSLQYREYGTSVWNTYTTYTFTKADFKNETSNPKNNIGGNILFRYFANAGLLIGFASHLFNVQLALDQYEFRAYKTSGDGTVSISFGEAETYIENDIISGKTTSKYQRAYRIPLPNGSQWDVRVRRITADSVSAALNNKTFWDSYTEIIDTKLSYPNSAVIGLQINAEQFSRIPVRGYDIKGMKVQIPSNYDPLTRGYTGSWNGTFIVAWTDNPAWIFYDLVLSNRYGLGDLIDSAMIDKWGLYTIAQYCDELVDDGFGGTEPRFTCNLFLQTREQAYQVLTNLASVFRAMVYWSSGAIYVSQDAPKLVSQLFSPSNVVDGIFNYSGSSGRVRHTVALVTWNDPSDGYKPKIEYVSDNEAITRYGIIQADLTAVGCTSRGQAARIGRWLIYSEQNEIETITFTAGLDSVFIQAGDVIETNDPNRAGLRLGGRIDSATTTQITLDHAITIQAGKTYEISCKLSDNTIETRTVTNSAGSTAIIIVSSAFTSAPLPFAMWIISVNDLVPEQWRVVSISENNKNQVEITALSYNPNKYVAVEQDLILQPMAVSIVQTANPEKVSNINVVETLYLAGLGVVGIKATVSWDSSLSVGNYSITYNQGSENPTTITSEKNTIEISGLSEGRYTFEIVAIDSLGRKSIPAEKIVDILGKTIPPINVSNFQVAPLGSIGLFTWDIATDLDVLVGGKVKFRYSPDTSATWESAQDLLNEASGNQTSITLPLQSGIYLTKFVDSSNNYSTSETSIITNSANILPLNFVQNLEGQPNWTGTKTNVQYDSSLTGIKLSSYDLWDSSELIDSDELVDYGDEGCASNGQYYLGEIDLLTPQTVRISSLIEAYALDLENLWDSDELMNTNDLVDSPIITDVNGIIWYRSSDNMSTWSDWKNGTLADITARGYQFELRLTSGSILHNILVSSATASIDVPDRIESGDDIISGASSYTVTYSKPFILNNAIGISAQNMNTGDYYRITSKTLNGFIISFYNSSNTLISRTFDYISKGF